MGQIIGWKTRISVNGDCKVANGPSAMTVAKPHTSQSAVSEPDWHQAPS